MNYIQMTAKKRGLSQEQLDVLSTAMYERIMTEANKHMYTGKRQSTGYIGKYFEPLVRHLLTSHGLTENDFHARRNGTNDHTVEDGVIYLHGQRFTYEVKTGDGIITYIEPTEAPEWSDDDILPSIDLVMYACDVATFTCEDDILDNTIVLTRAEFLQFLCTEGPKRSQTIRTATKAATNDHQLRTMNKYSGTKYRDCIILQSAYHSARSAACQSGDYLSLRSFLQENGRA